MVGNMVLFMDLQLRVVLNSPQGRVGRVGLLLLFRDMVLAVLELELVDHLVGLHQELMLLHLMD
jgi:hypothetical protein